MNAARPPPRPVVWIAAGRCSYTRARTADHLLDEVADKLGARMLIDAQENGLIPLDESLDEYGIIDHDDRGPRFPYGLADDARRVIHALLRLPNERWIISQSRFVSSTSVQ